VQPQLSGRHNGVPKLILAHENDYVYTRKADLSRE